MSTLLSEQKGLLPLSLSLSLSMSMLSRRVLNRFVSPLSLPLRLIVSSRRTHSLSVEEAQQITLRRLRESLNYTEDYLIARLPKHFKKRTYAKQSNARGSTFGYSG